MIIRGIAQPQNFPDIESCESKYCQHMIDYEFTLPESKPSIERINNVAVDSKINKYKIIQTPVGFKIIISGELCTTIEYTADCSAQTMHSAHDKISFRTFIDIPIDQCGLSLDTKCIVKYKSYMDRIVYGEPDILVESVDIEQTDKFKISICTILFIWVELCDCLFSQENKN